MKEFQPTGPSWDERAQKDDLAAVLDPVGSRRKNLYINSIHQRAIGRTLKNISEGMSLDLGCGTGRMTKMLADRGWHAVGIDITLSMLKQARAKVESPNVSFLNMDGLILPIRDASFDLILTVYTLQHILPSPHLFAKLAAEIFRILKPTGRLVMLEITDTRKLGIEEYKMRLAEAGLTLIHDEPVRLRFDRFMTLAEQRHVPSKVIPLLGALGIWLCRWRYSRGETAKDWWDHLYVLSKRPG
jgi:ubiquinone/menaquinone biosynthesis C-methylase UbiE